MRRYRITLYWGEPGTEDPFRDVASWTSWVTRAKSDEEANQIALEAEKKKNKADGSTFGRESDGRI